jgi:CheY-like chemotaxis protein
MSSDSTTPVVPEAEAQRMRVLVVEDGRISAKVVIKLLHLLDCDATHAADGEQGLEAATTASFDLVLMDLEMPVMDGITSTKNIRAHEQATGTPRVAIFALTATDSPDNAETCMAAGMDGHLVKPLGKETLQRLLASVRASKKPQDMARTGNIAVDVEKALERCAGDHGLLADVVTAYEESLVVNGALLRDAADNDDGKAVYRAAHTLKGVFLYICADGAASIAQSLCQAGNSGDMTDVRPLMESLFRECGEVSRVLALAIGAQRIAG